MHKTLEQVVNETPFPDYQVWWDVGETFLGFMSEAIVSEWRELEGNQGDLEMVNHYFKEYIQVVYGREVRAGLLDNFVEKRFESQIQSGEFDGLSYAFYRSAFEMTEKQRLFTKRVGARFFAFVDDHLKLDIPEGLKNEADFAQLKKNLRQVGEFLQTNGYLRDHFDFRFTLNEENGDAKVEQDEADFMENIKGGGTGYALYEMGYPIILPSAVYLYHTLGEAQHHSSRTIEELFARVGFEARETDDFDPVNYPAEQVVELWEIRKLG